MIIDNSKIYDALNITAITDLLDVWKDTPCLFDTLVIDKECTGVKTINFYIISEIQHWNNYWDIVYVVNCRANNRTDAEAISQAIASNLDCTTNAVGDYFMIATRITIPPQQETDSYNSPIALTIRIKG